MLIFEVEVIKTFLLVLVRFSGLVIAAPVLGSRNVPAVAKVGLAGLCAVVLTPTLAAQPTALPEDALSFAMMGVGELVIGLLIGFVMTMVFAAIQVGGQIMDMQTGFGMMNVFNPAMETQFPIFGFYFFIIAVLYLLTLNGHLMMIKALASTFDKIPLGGFVVRPELFLEVPKWGSAMFLDGLMIAAPVAGAMMLAYITMGLLGRVVPQIHLFVVGFPVTIATGLFVVALATGTYLAVLGDLSHGMFGRMFRNVSTLVEGMGPS